MSEDTLTSRPESWTQRHSPRARVRVQLLAAAVTWLVAAASILFRGVTFLADEHWALWLVALAAILGVAKGHMVMSRASARSISRIRTRGRACVFGYFSWTTWLVVVAMMAGGVLLRHSGLDHSVLAVVYLAIGTGLLYADRTFWAAASDSRPST